MSEEAEVTPEVTEEVAAETPALEEKSVLELAAEEEVAPAVETPEATPIEEPEEVPEEPTEEPVEEIETPAEEPRQVPVSALQKERQRRREAEARAQEQEARIAALEAQKPPIEKPTIDQFETQEQYLEALAEQKAEEKVAQQFQMQGEAQRQAEQRKQGEAELTKFTSLMDKAHVADPEFEKSFEYVSDVSGAHPGYSRALVTSEIADKVISHLAKNPAEAERIATLSPEGQVKAIGVIESKIQTPPKPQRTTRAPAPVATVSGTASTAPPVEYKEDMSVADKQAWKEQAEASGKSIAELFPE